MSSINMPDTVVAKLKQLAEQSCWDDAFTDDTVVDDFAGGNVDDAYNGGERTGQVLLAREILDEMKIPYQAHEE